MTEDFNDSENQNDPGTKPYQSPHFSGPKTPDDVIREVQQVDHQTLHFDMKFNKAREMLIYMEETKIWQELAEECVEKAGVNASYACRQLQQMVQERVDYYNSNYNVALRPKMTPGIPAIYERVVAPNLKKL